MQIILSAVLYKDNLSLISIPLCLYFHQRSQKWHVQSFEQPRGILGQPLRLGGHTRESVGGEKGRVVPAFHTRLESDPAEGENERDRHPVNSQNNSVGDRARNAIWNS